MTANVVVDVRDGSLVVEPRGSDIGWTLKRRIEIPVSHVREIRVVENPRRELPLGLRLPGTHVPFLITAGSYWSRKHGWSFWDIRRGRKALVIELSDERYERIVLEMDDIETVAERLRRRLRE